MENPHNPNIKDILNSPTRLTESSGNLLTQLFRKTLLELGIGSKIFDTLVKRYLVDPNSGIADDSTARNNHRGNLMKELASSNMSWGVFMKALRVIGVSEFEVAISIKRKDVITRHIVFAKNEISYEEPKEDLSNAIIIPNFESDSLKELREKNTIEYTPPPTAYVVPEGLRLPEGI